MKLLQNGYTRNTNKLRSVRDAVSSGNYGTDIDNQSSNNYVYDELGNLVADEQEEIDNIGWTVYGKIKTITRTTGSTKPDLVFAYDASGNRVSKTMIPRDGSGQRPTAEWITTNYVRDAQGNVMSTYELANATFTLKEQMLYGSSRLGTLNRALDLTSYTANDVVTRVLGKKNFELVNHLGNVLSVTSDRKLTHSTSGTTIDYYLADIQSATDYGVWGDPLPGRNFVGATGYKYGFNGMEKDDEVKGNGNSYDFGARIYDSRIGRWLTLDPEQRQYAGLSPYNFAANNPIIFVDPDGKKIVIAPGLSKEDNQKVGAALCKIEEKQLEFYTYLNTVRVHDNDDGTQTLVELGQPGYDEAFDILIEVGVANTDGKIKADEQKANNRNEFTSGATFQMTPKTISDQEGEAHRVPENSRFSGVSQKTGQVLVEGVDKETSEKTTAFKDVKSVVDLSQKGSLFKMVYDNNNKPHFTANVDDFVGQGASIGQVISHELGHIESMIKDPAAAFFYRRDAEKGHSSGNPGGTNAGTRQAEYDK